ncbi:MAG: SH3 domain-containing protein, partial [Eubacteriales bacterium]|nr:SH3 domain-containing protein [Eubacteriales bacterium]
MKNKKKTVICCTLTAVLTLTASTPVFADSVWNYRAVADSLEGVNIRSSASENSTIVGYLPTGGSADIIEVGEEWTLVVSGGVQGYVKNEYLATGDQAAYLADVYGYDGVRTDWDGVNFFSQPDGASQVVDTASAGSEYILLEDQGDWLTVQLPDSTIAYVPAEDVQSTTVLARATAAESSYSETSTVSYEDTSYSTDTTYYETEATVYSEPEYYETEAPTYSEPEYYE